MADLALSIPVPFGTPLYTICITIEDISMSFL